MEIKKLYKVKLGRPTGGSNWITWSSGSDRKIKEHYFVVAKTFNEAGKLVSDYIEKIMADEKSSVVVTEFGLEKLDENISVCTIELVGDELIFIP